MRAFIAIQLPPEVKGVLERIEGRLKAGFTSPSAKWVAVPSIHLTLKFLGNVEAAKIEPITVAIARAAEETSPVQLDVGGLGAFPNLRRVDVVWVGLTGDLDCLCQLQEKIETNMRPLGFRPEARPFSPHLTIARLREQATNQERQALGEIIASAGIDSPGRFKVDSLYLMRSQLMRSGPIYSELSHVKLSEVTGRIASKVTVTEALLVAS